MWVGMRGRRGGLSLFKSMLFSLGFVHGGGQVAEASSSRESEYQRGEWEWDKMQLVAPAGGEDMLLPHWLAGAEHGWVLMGIPCASQEPLSQQSWICFLGGPGPWRDGVCVGRQ